MSVIAVVLITVSHFAAPAAATNDNLVDAGKFYFSYYETHLDNLDKVDGRRLRNELTWNFELHYVRNLGVWKASEQNILSHGRDQGHFTFFNAHGISLAKVLLSQRQGEVGPISLRIAFSYPMVCYLLGYHEKSRDMVAVLSVSRGDRTLHEWIATTKATHAGDVAAIQSLAEEVFAKFHIQVEEDRKNQVVTMEEKQPPP